MYDLPARLSLYKHTAAPSSEEALHALVVELVDRFRWLPELGAVVRPRGSA